MKTKQANQATRATRRDQHRLRHEHFITLYQPQLIPGNLRNRLNWRNQKITTALSEGREFPNWQSYIRPSEWDWEYWTDNGSKLFIEDIKDYIESGRALSHGVSEEVCNQILESLG